MQLEVGLPVDAYLLGAHRLVITVRYFPPDQRQAVPSVWKQIRAREDGSPKGQAALAAWFTTAVPKVTPLQRHDSDYSYSKERAGDLSDPCLEHMFALLAGGAQNPDGSSKPTLRPDCVSGASRPASGASRWPRQPPR
jgi:hypothetical protein